MSLCLMSCFRRVLPESEFDRWMVYGGRLSLETADLRTEGSVTGELSLETADLRTEDSVTGGLSLGMADLRTEGSVTGELSLETADLRTEGSVTGGLSLERADLRTEEACKRQICSESPPLCRFNIFLTPELLRVCGMSVSLHPVISFSVINYVVSMRCLTRVTRLIFLYHIERGGEIDSGFVPLE